MKFIESIKNVWKIEELRDRILVTLSLLLVYRFGAQVVLPGIDAAQLSELSSNTESGLLGLLNAFTGGAFANASVFALGIMPYMFGSGSWIFSEFSGFRYSAKCFFIRFRSIILLFFCNHIGNRNHFCNVVG